MGIFLVECLGLMELCCFALDVVRTVGRVRVRERRESILHCEPSAKNSTMTRPRRARTKKLSVIVISSAPGMVEIRVMRYVGVVIKNKRIF